MKTLRQHLGWKLFVSYVTIIVVGVLSLAVAADWHAPTAIGRHMAGMPAMMGGDMGMMADLSENFRQAINEVLVVAASLAFVTAVVVSSFVTRRIVRPVQAMTAASRRIAAGGYDERVRVAGEDELADLAASFNQMAETLARTEERRRQLIGDVAHELRTPLSSLQSVMEGLQDGVLPADAGTFGNVQREVTRLQRLVHDLEELSRAEAGQLPLERVAVGPAAVVEAAAARLRPQFEDKGVALRLELPADLPAIWADPARLTQVMLNLLGNALQYTPAGGQVAVSGRVAGGDVQLKVRDTGIGLAVDELPHVFERFYRADKSRSRAGGGSGIGLTISKHLVEAHGGRIRAASPGRGQGSTFTLSLPIAP